MRAKQLAPTLFDGRLLTTSSLFSVRVGYVEVYRQLHYFVILVNPVHCHD